MGLVLSSSKSEPHGGRGEINGALGCEVNTTQQDKENLPF